MCSRIYIYNATLTYSLVFLMNKQNEFTAGFEMIASAPVRVYQGNFKKLIDLLYMYTN